MREQAALKGMNEEQTASLKTALLHGHSGVMCGPGCEPSHQGLVELARCRSDLSFPSPLGRLGRVLRVDRAGRMPERRRVNISRARAPTTVLVLTGAPPRTRDRGADAVRPECECRAEVNGRSASTEIRRSEASAGCRWLACRDIRSQRAVRSRVRIHR